jgi:hypothetical protein
MLYPLNLPPSGKYSHKYGLQAINTNCDKTLFFGIFESARLRV